MTGQEIGRCCQNWTWTSSLLVAVSLMLPAASHSADRVAKRAEARQLVDEALHRELYGLAVERKSLLETATDLGVDFAPAYWHSGHVRYRNKWAKFDELSNDSELTKRLRLYQRARSKTQPTVTGYLALANWCAENKMPLQERAHLWQVLQQVPDHGETRRRLGFVQVNGQWVGLQTIWQGLDDARKSQAALAKWRRPLIEIRKGLQRRGEAQRNAARDKLLAIDDPEAIVPLEQLAGTGHEAGLLVVEAISQMPQSRASAALVRQAVFSPFPRVREESARLLGPRPMESYVPSLLAEMAMPIQSRIQTASRNGQATYRHIFFREAQQQNQVVVLDTNYRRLVSLRRRQSTTDDADDDGPRGSGLSFGDAVLMDFYENVEMREQQRRLQNVWTKSMNDRICHVLRTGTGQQLASFPEVWWEWWNQHNQIVQLGNKQTNFQFRQETKTFQDSVDVEAPQAGPPQRPRRRCECFAAGTPVWTVSGANTIESIQVGDLVLSQHPDTGELAFKPVLATTVRPPERLIKIQSSRSLVEATGGHPLWVSGRGWVVASELTSGTTLHGVDGGVLVTETKPGNVERAYNLVVADFHTYFVGNRRVLAHDNTPRRPTNSIVPGLVEHAR